MTDIDLRQLQHDAYANACEKGWHERPLVQDGVVDHDRVLAKLALVHSELGEAWEARQTDDLALRYEGGKPEGFVVEVADAVIRILDLCGALDLDVAREVSEPWPRVDYTTFYGYDGEALRTRYLVDRATEAARVSAWAEFACRLGEVLERLAVVCRMMQLDLAEAIAVKMAYNATRPHRHGGKQA